jgi:hypothetical protein
MKKTYRSYDGIGGSGILFFLFLLLANLLSAHPSPNTLILLDIKKDGVAMEIRLPVSELGMALSANPATPKTAEEILGSFKDSLSLYIKSHLNVLRNDGQRWNIEIDQIALEDVKNPQLRNTLQDIIINLRLIPPGGTDHRQFILHYDVVIHEVVTHSALVSIRQDWETGIVAEHPAEVGVIAVEPRSGQIFPLIQLENRGLWGGFRSMIRLGMRHIAEGTDHLLFLLVLLLAAPLVVSGNKWRHFGGIKHAFKRLLGITVAFTLGHSLTLLAGSAGWLRLPGQPVEILIAASILISAVHAIRPIFPTQEQFVAAGFGLIHGLAFASTLSGLDLDTQAMILSILGFNIGIELQQLIVIALTVPSLLLLSQRPKIYDFVRIGTALLAGTAAIVWIFERISGDDNFLSAFIENLFAYGYFGVIILAVLAIFSRFFVKRNLHT